MKRFIIIATSLLLAACGSMQVQVSVLQPQTVEAEMDRLYVRDSLPFVMAMTPHTIQSQYRQLQTKHAQVLSELVAAYETAGKPENADAIRAQIKPIAQRYPIEGEAVTRLVERIQSLSADPVQQTVLMRQLDIRQRNFLLIANRGMAQAVRAAGNDKDVVLPPEVQTKANEVTAETNRLLIGDGTITGQRVAYAVTNAKDNLWAPIFDRSYGAGRLGKMEFAVKMETRGVFTIKGMSFDPADVARMASKVTSQALMIVSQMSGVPLKSGTFTGDGAALAKSSVQFSTDEEARMTADANLADRRAALLELAQQILARRPNITNGTAAQLQDAMTAIQAKFNSTKTRLEAP